MSETTNPDTQEEGEEVTDSPKKGNNLHMTHMSIYISTLFLHSFNLS